MSAATVLMPPLGLEAGLSRTESTGRLPLVSIITPSFNHAAFIRQTIQSVLEQDYPGIEYIIMDGGSSDGTAAIASEYSSRLTFVSEKDRGQSHAINKGFQMARGEVVAWINSDDILLPGAVSAAVRGFAANPAVGAVYGEGYLMDRSGQLLSRFPHTQPFDLWRLLYLSDYVLQQSAFFRRDVVDEVGYLREDLNYCMDWDLLIRIGKRYPLRYLREYLGAIREYPETKTGSGGGRRVREILRMLREHTGQPLPPGAILYGLETYSNLAHNALARVFRGPLAPAGEMAQVAMQQLCGVFAERLVRQRMGWYSDGWVGRKLHYLLPAGEGPLTLRGHAPGVQWLLGQTLELKWNGEPLATLKVPPGDFEITLPVGGPRSADGTSRLEIRPSLSFVPAYHDDANLDRRRIAILLRNLVWQGELFYPPIYT